MRKAVASLCAGEIASRCGCPFVRACEGTCVHAKVAGTGGQSRHLCMLVGARSKGRMSCIGVSLGLEVIGRTSVATLHSASTVGSTLGSTLQSHHSRTLESDCGSGVTGC